MRRVRRKVGSKEKVFGCDLLEHLNASSQEVPLVLRCCSDFVETHGIVDGIYRLSGVSSNIQKLRGEFESDGSPDLNKDVYLQDIHCVSSLCKAYFRELPNPLLTYQLYDKFAEAVAIQLEEERLVKIRDVLKELPRPHYRTLEFLMRHLVKMASFSSETNMHARNLAIVWAPNLLRSKDIEASGFNGTAVFKEVRVQSIVVEFILTHVPQLFPDLEVSGERRKSLPSPSAAFNQEEVLFKSGTTQPVPNIGNISPGAGPLAMRPYHAIIEGTDKRKGSLKGRKWMSIFNIGGRFHEQRRRHKHSAKEKDRPTLRSARSMDSLSDPSYPNEGLRCASQRPPPANTSTASPLASSSSSQSGSDASIFSSAIGGSEYAVTYRRGTGCVGSGAGTQGTYTALDPDGTGAPYNETVQSRSPGHSTKVGRRAAMHITGPTMVTVPLHITSNLALGVLQGGGGNRVIHRGRDKDGADRVEGKEGEEKAERRKNREIEWNVKNDREVEEEEKSQRSKAMDVDGVEDKAATPVAGAARQEDGEGKMEKEKEELASGGGGGSREHRAKSVTSNTEEDNDEHVNDEKVDDYMGKDIKSESPDDLQTDVTQHDCDDCALGASNILNSTAVEGDDLGLSGYVQDNFEFLDQMDCSVLDHMDQCVPYQVNEFSVEPPGHSYDEYEVMEHTGLSPDLADDDYGAMEQTPDHEYEMMGQAQASHHPAELHAHLQPGPGEQQPHRLLSIDANTRHVKSLSLPYMTSPVHMPEELGSEEEYGWDRSDNDYSSEEEFNMCVQSLPLDYNLSSMFEKDIRKGESCAPDEVPLHQLQISEGLNNEPPACTGSAAEVQGQEEVKDDEEGDGPEVNVFRGTEEEDKVERSDTGDGGQSKECDRTEEEEDINAEDCQISDESSTMAGTLAGEQEEEEKEAVVECPDNDAHFDAQKDTANSSLVECTELSMTTTEQPRTSAEEDTEERGLEEEDLDAHKDERDAAREKVLEIKEGDGNVAEGTIEEDGETVDGLEAEEKMQDESRELEFPSWSSDIWDELQDVVCEVIEEEEGRHTEREGEEDVAGRGKVIQNAKAEETEERIEADGGETETEIRLEIVEESGVTDEKVPNAGRGPEFEENDTNSIKTKEPDEEMQRKQTTGDDSDAVFFRERDNDDRKQGKQPGENMFRSDMTERTTDDNDGNQGGVGSKIVVFKHPKIHQVKAVPVVPPKPQHCRITALALRQQQQQHREKRDTDRGWDNSPKVLTEQDAVYGGEQEKDRDGGSGTKEKPAPRGEEADKERWRDADENAARDARRNSPLSMCFDEAVAKATMRREKEKEHEKERQREWGNEAQ